MRKRFLGVMTVLAIAGCGTSLETIPQGDPPVIQSITAEDSDIKVGSGIRFKADVQSESGKVAYQWQANTGIVSKPYEESLMWLAPPTVPYSPYPVTVTLTIKDKFGRTAKSSCQIRVYQQ